MTLCKSTSRVCVYIQCECYILNTHMYHLIAMNDLVRSLKKEWRKAPIRSN